MESKSRLKDRLARIFRPSVLIRSSATVSSRTHSAAMSSRSFSAAASSRSFSAAASSRSLSFAADIAHEPVFIPCRRASESEELNLSLLHRSFSLDHRPRRHFVGCGGCRPAATMPEMPGKGRMDGKVVETYNLHETELRKRDGRTCPPASPSQSPNSAHLFYYCYKETELEKKRKKKKIMMRQKQRSRSTRNELSLSSSFDEEGFGFFSSGETETFFSTRSFSSDSSEFYRRPSPKTNKTCKKKGQSNKKNKVEESSILQARQRRPRRRATMAVGKEARFRDSFGNGFQPLLTISFSEDDESKRTCHEAFPVLKKSCDPYRDFRSSMAEMIVERQIFGARELQRLLNSYLSLNHPENHSAILRAFADISKVLFSY